jgi:hypothetical protein
MDCVCDPPPRPPVRRQPLSVSLLLPRKGNSFADAMPGQTGTRSRSFQSVELPEDFLWRLGRKWERLDVRGVCDRRTISRGAPHGESGALAGWFFRISLRYHGAGFFFSPHPQNPWAVCTEPGGPARHSEPFPYRDRNERRDSIRTRWTGGPGNPLAVLLTAVRGCSHAP